MRDPSGPNDPLPELLGGCIIIDGSFRGAFTLTYPGCGGSGQLGVLPEPEYLAAKLAMNVEPELFDDLVAMAAAAASVQTDPQLKVYWEKVHRTLAP